MWCLWRLRRGGCSRAGCGYARGLDEIQSAVELWFDGFDKNSDFTAPIVFCDPPSSIHPSSIHPGHFHSFPFILVNYVMSVLHSNWRLFDMCQPFLQVPLSPLKLRLGTSAPLRCVLLVTQSTGTRLANQYNLIRYGYILFMAHILQAPKSPNEINQFWHLRSASFNDHQLGRTPLNLTTPHQSLMKMRGSPMDLWMLPLRST